MGGGLIQLVAYGIEDLFLTRDPQITFFKIVYRRHTNFSVEPIPQNFIQPLDFGRKATCIVSKQGDLIGEMFLVITLPGVNVTVGDAGGDAGMGAGMGADPLLRFAWVRKIGFAMIKTIEIVIGGELIDRQYGEWLNVWFELMGSKNNLPGLNRMIGNVPELTDFSLQKDEYTLYVPLQFWFCRNSGSALPLVSLQYSEVKVNIELNDVDHCFIVTPTHYINVLNDFINLKPFEYIEQVVDGRVASGIYTHYDLTHKRLYFMKISREEFRSVACEPTTISDAIGTCFDPRNTQYFIRGADSGYVVMPKFMASSVAIGSVDPVIRQMSLPRCFLLIDYIFLDEDERVRFLQTKHDYLIEQVSFMSEQTIESSNVVLDVSLFQPCKFITWVVQSSYLLDRNNNDRFNYSDDHRYVDGKPVGKSLVLEESLLINGRERLSFRGYQYFNYVQPYQHFCNPPSEGVNVYSFALFPDKFQPSGSCNMSQLDNIQIRLRVSPQITPFYNAKFRGYALNYNVLRIVNGLSGIVFSRPS